ncbi:MAG: DUF2007 domain-containing protein [Ilumatobacteraceae bacterium]
MPAPLGRARIIRIDRFTSRTEAELARAVLESNGIEAYVSGDDAGGLHPELPYGIGGTAVVVHEDRYAEAIALLDDEFGSGDAAGLEAAALAAGPHPDDPGGVHTTETTGATGLDRRWRLIVVVAVLVMLLAAVLTTETFSVLVP